LIIPVYKILTSYIFVKFQYIIINFHTDYLLYSRFGEK